MRHRAMLLAALCALSATACSSESTGSSTSTLFDTTTALATTVAPRSTTSGVVAPTTTITQASTPAASAAIIGPRQPDRFMHNSTVLKRADDGSGTIAAAVYDTSSIVRLAIEGNAPPWPGALVKLSSPELSILVSTNAADVERLEMSSGWTKTVLSSDPTWTPAGCGETPSLFVGGRWEVTLEARSDLDPATKLPPIDGAGEAWYSTVLVAFDLVDGRFHELTPWPSPEVYDRPVALDDHRITMLVTPPPRRHPGTADSDAARPSFDPPPALEWAVQRTIDLATMSFEDVQIDLSGREIRSIAAVDGSTVYASTPEADAAAFRLTRRARDISLEPTDIPVGNPSIDDRSVTWDEGAQTNRLVDTRTGDEILPLTIDGFSSSWLIGRRGTTTVVSTSWFDGASYPFVVDETTATITSVFARSMIDPKLRANGEPDFDHIPPPIFIAGLY